MDHQCCYYRGHDHVQGVDVFTFDESSGRILSVRAYWERARVQEERQRLARTRGMSG